MNYIEHVKELEARGEWKKRMRMRCFIACAWGWKDEEEGSDELDNKDRDNCTF